MKKSFKIPDLGKNRWRELPENPLIEHDETTAPES